MRGSERREGGKERRVLMNMSGSQRGIVNGQEVRGGESEGK